MKQKLALKKLLARYDYKLPTELIDQKPQHPRDRARLLVYDRETKKVSYDIFKNLGQHLPKNAVLVFNQTRVIPARLMAEKETGGRVEMLYIDVYRNLIKVIGNKKLSIGNQVTLLRGRAKVSLKFKVVKQQGQFYFLKPSFPISKIHRVLKKYGQTPLPPYIKNSSLNEKQKRQEYQTVFAKIGESVAAPTASLHFTKKLMLKLKKRGIAIKFVRLDVNLGTFAPLKEENLETGQLHLENYYIDAKTAQAIITAKKQNHPIIAVGTTVIRTLETFAKTKKLSGSTQLFIRPGYKFKLVDGLVTNFHVPKSSLLMLVVALVGKKRYWICTK